MWEYVGVGELVLIPSWPAQNPIFQNARLVPLLAIRP